MKELQNEVMEKTRLLVQARQAIEALQAEDDFQEEKSNLLFCFISCVFILSLYSELCFILINTSGERCDACFADLERACALAAKWENEVTELQQQLQASQKTVQEKELRERLLERMQLELSQSIQFI